MVNVVVMGESMLELSSLGDKTCQLSFAGDVYNTAIYLKRLVKDKADVSFFTATGSDNQSLKMREDIGEHDISTRYAQIIDDRTVGAYFIELQPNGERQFVYWRDKSAAKVMFNGLDTEAREKLIKHTDMFYFSGISIAILEPEQRNKLWSLIEEMKQKGTKVIFDSNYRPKLWESELIAKDAFEQAVAVSDIVFAGIEDYEMLYKTADRNKLLALISTFSANEIIIKDGANDVQYVTQGEKGVVRISPVDHVVDTTSAGDSFNGGYIAARIKGHFVSSAIEIASQVSAFVIQHKGAIVEEKTFTSFVESKLKNPI